MEHPRDSRQADLANARATLRPIRPFASRAHADVSAFVLTGSRRNRQRWITGRSCPVNPSLAVMLSTPAPSIERVIWAVPPGGISVTSYTPRFLLCGYPRLTGLTMMDDWSARGPESQPLLAIRAAPAH
jgi:hypothetical protein